MNLLDLVTLIFVYNIMTLSNGPVTIALLQASLVDQHHALTLNQLLYAFTIGRVTPGPASAYVASIGYMLFGFAGAILTTIAIVLPGYLMLPLLKSYESFRTSVVVENFTRGLTATLVGLIFAGAVKISSHTLTNAIALVVFALTFVFTFIFKWNTILSLAVASGVGFILNIWLS